MARTTLRLRSSKAPAQPIQKRTRPASASPVGADSKIVRHGAAPSPCGAARDASASPRTETSRPLAQSSRAALRLAPRVAGVLHVAEGGVELLRESALLEHRVAADLDDRVDVLDEHRAALDAPAAGRALPDRLLGDGVVHQRQAERLLGALSGQARAPPPRPPRRRWLPPSTPAAPMRPPPAPSRPPGSGRAGPPSGASGESVLPVTDAGQNSMHRPHSVQASGSRRCRQVRSLRPLAPKTGSGSPSLRLGLEIHLAQRAARLEALGVDVRLAADDVEVLAVRQVRDEAEHEPDVRPGHDPKPVCAASGPMRRQRQAQRAGQDGPGARRMVGLDARRRRHRRSARSGR